jgi:hypothetical protein
MSSGYVRQVVAGYVICISLLDHRGRSTIFKSSLAWCKMSSTFLSSLFAVPVLHVRSECGSSESWQNMYSASPRILTAGSFPHNGTSLITYSPDVMLCSSPSVLLAVLHVPTEMFPVRESLWTLIYISYWTAWVISPACDLNLTHVVTRSNHVDLLVHLFLCITPWPGICFPVTVMWMYILHHHIEPIRSFAT